MQRYQVTAEITEVFDAEDADDAVQQMVSYLRAEGKPDDFNYEVELVASEKE